MRSTLIRLGVVSGVLAGGVSLGAGAASAAAPATGTTAATRTTAAVHPADAIIVGSYPDFFTCLGWANYLAEQGYTTNCIGPNQSGWFDLYVYL